MQAAIAFRNEETDELETSGLSRKKDFF